MLYFRKLLYLSIIFIAALQARATKYDEDFLKNYLKSLKSVVIEFDQVLGGDDAEGVLLVDKPNYFRCSYFKGSPLLITGNSSFISVYDYDLDELTNIDRNNNIFKFVILDNKQVDKIRINKINDYNDSIEFASEDDERNEFLITLSKNPIKLQRISSYDINGQELTINFKDIRKAKFGNKTLFSIKNPKLFGPPKKLKEEELKNFYLR